MSIPRSAAAAAMFIGAMASPGAAQTARVAPNPPPNVSHPLHRLFIAARVRVDSEPDWMAPAPGVLWVTTYRPGALHRIDTRTNRVTASLWVPVRVNAADSLSRGLARVDAATGRLVATIAVRSGSTTVASGFGSVWVAESGVDSVARVDPRTSTTGSGASPSLPSAALRLVRRARLRSAEA